MRLISYSDNYIVRAVNIVVPNDTYFKIPKAIEIRLEGSFLNRSNLWAAKFELRTENPIAIGTNALDGHAGDGHIFRDKTHLGAEAH